MVGLHAKYMGAAPGTATARPFVSRLDSIRILSYNGPQHQTGYGGVSRQA
jgi:hypothetical protein